MPINRKQHKQEINKFHFFNFPEKRRIEDYEKTKAEIISFLRNRKDILAIYSCGSTIKSPGLSDLDFCAITDENIREGSRINPSSFVIHPDIFYRNEYLFKNMQRYFLFHNLHHEYGKKIKILGSTQKEKALRDIMTLIAMSITRSFKLENYLRTKNINSMYLLHALNSTIYSIETFNSLLPSNEKKDFMLDYIKKVRNLRNVWFDLTSGDQRSNLYGLFLEILIILKFMIKKLQPILTNHSMDFEFDYSIKQKKVYLGSNRLLVFDDEFFEKNFLSFDTKRPFYSFLPSKLLKIEEAIRFKTLFLPEKLYNLFFMSLSIDTFFSKKFRKNLIGNSDGKLIDEIDDTFLGYFNILSENLKYNLRNNFLEAGDGIGSIFLKERRFIPLILKKLPEIYYLKFNV